MTPRYTASFVSVWQNLQCKRDREVDVDAFVGSDVPALPVRTVLADALSPGHDVVVPLPIGIRRPPYNWRRCLCRCQRALQVLQQACKVCERCIMTMLDDSVDCLGQRQSGQQILNS
jgi:hypothetical protein